MRCLVHVRFLHSELGYVKAGKNMSSKEFIQFRNVLSQHEVPLRTSGYIPVPSEFDYHLDYTRIIQDNIQCYVSLQLLGNGTPPNEINVWLKRRHLKDTIQNSDIYTNLHMSLRNVMIGVYKQDPLPADYVGYWRYENPEELQTVIPHLVSLIVEYGIPWLENPTSNLNWLYRR